MVKLVGSATSEFGGGSLTRLGTVFGTPAYIAPEQALGLSVDGRADLYSMGVILYEMLTGQRPLDDDDPLVLLDMQVRTAPPHFAVVTAGKPWRTPQLIHLVMHALEKDPDRRFVAAAEMAAAVAAARESIGS